MNRVLIVCVFFLCFVSFNTGKSCADEPMIVRVGAFNYFPAIFQDQDGIVKGFYVDALTALGKQENIRFEYLYGSWNEGLERIKSGDVDLLTSVAWTEERSKFLDFSANPLLTVWGELYVPYSSEIDGIREVQGKRIAVMKGDFNAKNFIDLVKKLDITCEFIEVSGFDDVFSLIAEKMVDAGVVSNTYGAAKQTEYSLRSSGVVFNPFDIHFAVAKGKHSDVLMLLDSYLAKWRHQSDSPYNQARQKWSHGQIGMVRVIPEWLINTVTIFGFLLVCTTVFVYLLKKQIKRHTALISQSKKGLHDSEERFQRAIEEAPFPIMIHAEDGRVLAISRSWTELAGYTIVDIPTIADWTRNAYGKDHANVERDIETLYALKHRKDEGEYCITCKDGSKRIWEFSSVSLGAMTDGVRTAMSMAADVTERKRAEEALKKHLLVLTQPLDSTTGVTFFDLFNLEEIQKIQDTFAAATGVASLITTPDGIPITRPSNFCRLCSDIIRQTEKGLANCILSDQFLGAYNPEAPLFQRCLSGGLWDGGTSITVGGQHVANWLIGQVRDQEQDENKMLSYAEVIGVDKETFRVALAEVPIMPREQFSKISQALFVLANELSIKAYQNIQQARFITERTKVEKELQTKNSELERFTYTVSHDLKSPLITIQSYADIISQDLKEEKIDRIQKDINRISGAAQKMTALLNDLLKLSRAGKAMNVSGLVNMNQLVRDVISLLSGPLNQREIRLVVDQNLPDIEGDHKRFGEIFQNLIENATKYIGEQADPCIEIGVKSGELEHVYFVKDNGIGIDQRFQENIFGLFNKLDPKSPGTGVGLALVRRIVEVYGGRVWVESEGVGKGSTFYFSLPINKSK